MICNKCGGAIPDESKFCPHCGAMQAEPKKDIFCTECGLMLQKGTMFCPVCGTPIEGEKPSSQSIPAAAESAVPSVSGVMGTVSSIPQTVPQPIPQPVREPKPSDAVFGAFSSAYGSEPKPSDIAFAKPSNAVFGENVNAVSPEKPSDTAFAAQPEPAEAYAPEQISTPLSLTSLTKKKSRKWVGPVIGVAAAAVVVGGGAVVYNLNKSDITNMIMGDSAYAKMVEQSSVKKLAAGADSSAIAEVAGTAMAAAASSNMSDVNISELENAASDALEGDFDAIENTQGSGTGLNIRAIIEQMYGNMTEVTGYSGADVTISAEAKITETLRALATGGDSDASAAIDEILGMINSTEVQFTVLSAKDSASMYMGVNDKSSAFSFGVSGVMYTDGTVGIMFPKTSDTAIKYTIEEDGSVSVEDTAVLSFDEKEIERLKNELVDLYLAYYEKGEVTVTDADGVKTIAVKISAEQINAMIQQAAALIADDAYFSQTIVDYITANGGSLTVEQYKSEITDAVKDIEIDESSALVITTSVDKQNNILAKKLAAVNTEIDRSVEIGYNTKDKDTELFLAVKEDTAQVLTVFIDAENDTDGVITVSFDEYEGEARIENDEEFILDIRYSNYKRETLGKREVYTGSFEIATRKAVSLDTSEEYDSDAALLAALQSAKIIFDSDIEGDNILNQNITVEIPQYGSITLKTSQTLLNDVPEKLPDGAIDLNKYASEDITEDDVNELISAAEKLRDDIAAKCEGSASKLAEYLSQGANELLDSLLDEISPKADEEMINEVNTRADELNDRCYSFYYSYGDIIDEEFESRLDDLTERIYDTYLWGEVSIDELNDAVSRQEAIGEELDELTEELCKEAEKSIEKQYNDMSVDELESAKYALDSIYDYFLEEYGAQIKADPALSEAFSEVTEKKGESDSTYSDVEKMIKSGNIQVATIRTFKKAAAAYDISLTNFLNLFESIIDY